MDAQLGTMHNERVIKEFHDSMDLRERERMESVSGKKEKFVTLHLEQGKNNE